jgi:hypothetical protein
LSDNAKGLRVLEALSGHEKTTTNLLYNEEHQNRMKTVGEGYGVIRKGDPSRLTKRQHI